MCECPSAYTSLRLSPTARQPLSSASYPSPFTLLTAAGLPACPAGRPPSPDPDSAIRARRGDMVLRRRPPGEWTKRKLPPDQTSLSSRPIRKCRAYKSGSGSYIFFRGIIINVDMLCSDQGNSSRRGKGWVSISFSSVCSDVYVLHW